MPTIKEFWETSDPVRLRVCIVKIPKTVNFIMDRYHSTIISFLLTWNIKSNSTSRRESHDCQKITAGATMSRVSSVFSIPLYKMTNVTEIQTVFLLNESWFLVTSGYPCVHAHSASPSLPFRIIFIAEFYPPFLFSLQVCRFHTSPVRDNIEEIFYHLE